MLGMVKTKKKHPETEFSIKRYLVDESLTIAIGFVSMVAVVLMMPEVDEIIMPGHENKIRVGAFLGGYLNYSLIRHITNTVVPKKFVEK